MHQMLAAAETDLQPDILAREKRAQIKLKAVGVGLPA